MVVREVLLGILFRHCGQQEGPPLLVNALMVVGPVGGGGLQSRQSPVSVGQRPSPCMMPPMAFHACTLSLHGILPIVLHRRARPSCAILRAPSASLAQHSVASTRKAVACQSEAVAWLLRFSCAVPGNWVLLACLACTAQYSPSKPQKPTSPSTKLPRTEYSSCGKADIRECATPCSPHAARQQTGSTAHQAASTCLTA